MADSDWEDEADWEDDGPKSKTHSVAQSVGRGILHGGTGGFIDEIGGLAGKFMVGDGGVKLGANAAPAEDDTPEVRAAKLQLAQTMQNNPTGYQLTRDTVRKDMDAARAAHPDKFAMGELGGAVASSFLPGLNVAKGATLQRTMAQMALQGGLMGLGDSRADLTKGELGRAAFDTTVGAGLGAVGGAIGHGLEKGAGWLADKAVDKGDVILKRAIEKARAIGADKAAEKTAQARSAAGRAAQDTYKQLEHLRETGMMRALTDEERATAAKLTEELGQKAREKLLPSAAEKEATSAAYKEAASGESELADQIAQEELKPRVKKDLRQIIKSYGEPVVASALGGWAGDTFFDSPLSGGALGGLLGGRTRAGKMIADRLAKPGNQRLLGKALRSIGQTLGAGAESLPRARALGAISPTLETVEGGLMSIPQLAGLFEPQDQSGVLADALRRR